jgi:hypothetical protein
MIISLSSIGRSKYGIVSITVDVTMCVDIACILVAQHLNQNRLLKPAQIHDQTVIDESVRISKYFLWLCFVTITISVATYVPGETNAVGLVSNLLLLVVGGFCVSANMAFNMFFLVMDLKVSSLLLDQLDILADKQLLPMKVFCMARQDIHRRVENSRWASDFIIGPCLASLVSIVVVLFNVSAGEFSLGIAWILAIIHQLLFICVAFWYVAKINGKADALTLKLSTTSWVALEGIEQASTQAELEIDSRAYRKAVLGDLDRLSVHASSISQPISYTLVFKRVSWQNVAVSAAGFAVTVVVGVVKSSVERAAGG